MSTSCDSSFCCSKKFRLGILAVLFLNLVNLAHSDPNPKPVILINKGQIHVRDSVQRFGHIHTKTRAPRFMNMFGFGRRSSNNDLDPGISFSNNYYYPAGDMNTQQQRQMMDSSGFTPMNMNLNMSPSMSLVNSPVLGAYQVGNNNHRKQRIATTTSMSYAPPAPATQTVRYFADSSMNQPQAVYVGQGQQGTNQAVNYRQAPVVASPIATQSQSHGHHQHHQQPHIRNKRLQNWMNGMNGRLTDAMKNVRQAWRTMMYRRTSKPNRYQQQPQQNNKQNSGTIALPNQLTNTNPNPQASGSHKSERYRKGPPMPMSMGSASAPAPIMTRGHGPPGQGQPLKKQRRNGNDYHGGRSASAPMFPMMQQWDPQSTMRKLRQAFSNLISG